MTKVKKDKKIKKEPKERKRLTPSLPPISKKDIDKVGATEHCKGCEFFVSKQRVKRRPHCIHCRMRFILIFMENGYKKELKAKERFDKFYASREIQEETEAMESEPAPINEEPIIENNDSDDLNDIKFPRLNLNN